jgi:hypothetical protein
MRFKKHESQNLMVIPSPGEKNMNEQCDCKEEKCECGCECCNGDDQFERRFLTKAEQIEELESYLAKLKLEVQAVEEHLADLRK